MKWLIIGLLALVLSVSIALVALPDPGYVLIGYGNYSIETTLIVFLVVMGVAYLLLRALAGLWQVPGRVRHWGHRRHDRQFLALYNEAVMELVDGRIERAERRFGRLSRFPEAPLEVYLSAARAANRLDAGNRRDAYLQLALHRHPQAEIAIALVQTELLLAQAQLEQAQTTLARLQDMAPHSSEVLRLRMHLYLKQQDWQHLRDLLPELKRSRTLGPDQLEQLAVRVYREEILAHGETGNVEALKSGWKNLPPAVQANEGLLAVYVEQLARTGAAQQAEPLLREKLHSTWNARLVYLYGDLQNADPVSQQNTAERWLEQRPEDPVLLLTLGKISLRNQLWGKARNYFEASIAQHPTPEAYRLLGTLLERLEAADQAAECYRKGIELLGHEMPGLELTVPASELQQLEGMLPATRSA
jgi:HemY protein